MKVIVSRLSELFQFTGKQEFHRDGKYKKIKYLICNETADGVLIYNTLTREIIMLSHEEIELLGEDPYNRKVSPVYKFLVEHWFYIPETLDEMSMCYQIKQRYRTESKQERTTKINSFTILPTTVCNARCPYCYECGIEKYSMDEKMVMDTANYIKENASNSIVLRWFGGEPLCNVNAMNIITQKLNSDGVNFYSTITSNGFLFDTIPDNTIMNVWKLRSAQITLDGTRDKYNAVKGYVNCDGSAFDKVLDNIERLLQLGVRISVRFNITNENADDMIALIDILKNKFYNYKKFSVYCYPIFEGVGNPPYNPTDDEREKLYDDCIRVYEKIRECGLLPSSKLKQMTAYHCMADSGKSRVILPDGSVSLCQHYNSEEICGSIYNKRLNAEKVKTWSERTMDISECKECSLYPICYKLNKCPNEVVCSSGERRFNEYKLKHVILDEYEKYRNNQK